MTISWALQSNVSRSTKDPNNAAQSSLRRSLDFDQLDEGIGSLGKMTMVAAAFGWFPIIGVMCHFGFVGEYVEAWYSNARSSSAEDISQLSSMFCTCFVLGMAIMGPITSTLIHAMGWRSIFIGALMLQSSGAMLVYFALQMSTKVYLLAAFLSGLASGVLGTFTHYTLDITDIPTTFLGLAHFFCEVGGSVGAIVLNFLLNFLNNPNSIEIKSEEKWGKDIYELVPQTILSMSICVILCNVICFTLIWKNKKHFDARTTKKSDSDEGGLASVLMDFRFWITVVMHAANTGVSILFAVLWKGLAQKYADITDPQTLSYIFYPLLMTTILGSKFLASWIFDKFNDLTTIFPIHAAIMSCLIFLLTKSTFSRYAFVVVYILTNATQDMIWAWCAPMIIQFTGPESFCLKYGLLNPAVFIGSNFIPQFFSLESTLYPPGTKKSPDILLVLLISPFINVSCCGIFRLYSYFQ